MSEFHQYPHGLIGNCAYLALINKDTNIDWMCLPRFDSSFVFGALIAGEKGGEFSIKPAEGEFLVHQQYLHNTNILETVVNQGSHAYKVTDIAPRFMQTDRYYRPLMLIRKIEPLRGLPRVRVRCRPTGDYGLFDLRMERGSNHLRYFGLDESLRLTTDIPLNYVVEEKDFVVDRPFYLFLTYGAPLEGPIVKTAENFLSQTASYWQRWVKSTSIGKLYQTEVIRSALTLKICQYEDTGAVVAAPTTSLPEIHGGGRNWDYRFSWMRDTFYTLNAFNHIGHFEEMEKYFSFLANIPMHEKEKIQPLYGIVGQSELTEKILDHLPGYLGANKPVRIGNQAYTHIQNDVYGQILLAILPLYIDRRFKTFSRNGTAELVKSVLEKIERTINDPDAGLWEFRGMALKHTYTNLFQWAGSAAAAKIAYEFHHPDVARMALTLQKRAAANIERTYSAKHKAYTHAIDSPHLDASTLQLILMNYLPHNSQKAKDHLKALEKELRVNKGLFFRYIHEDDFGKPENTFMICGFWYAEALACVGRIEEAQEAFEELCSYGNHLGLFAEDIEPKTGSQWGNFPQAYSHVGLVNAAYRINNKINEPIFI